MPNPHLAIRLTEQLTAHHQNKLDVHGLEKLRYIVEVLNNMTKAEYTCIIVKDNLRQVQEELTSFSAATNFLFFLNYVEIFAESPKPQWLHAGRQI